MMRGSTNKYVKPSDNLHFVCVATRRPASASADVNQLEKP